MITIINKEISWLSFNERVLQESLDHRVPLIERLKFLGIYSSNMDEFFRIRVATLNRLAILGTKAKKITGDDPIEILNEIGERVLDQQKKFDKTFKKLLVELRQKGIYIINEQNLSDHHYPIVKNYFQQKVRPFLIPIMLKEQGNYNNLDDNAIYLAVSLKKSHDSPVDYALIEIPTNHVSRFFILPKEDKKQYIILLDDIIRFSLREIFSILNYTDYESYVIKVTRDAELYLDQDFSESLFRKVSKSLSKRKEGQPVRFVYDEAMQKTMLEKIKKMIGVDNSRINMVSGGRYHNFKDFINFPKVGKKSFLYPPLVPVLHLKINRTKSILAAILKNDILFHYPYQSFDYVTDFLREASIDPRVTSIRLTSYRSAKDSNVFNALINAARNGKQVTVVMELQARFDEEANIEWAKKLMSEGVHLISGVPDLKVHCKLILVTMKENEKKIYFGHIGTGNFNESTSRLYTDHSLFTANEGITKEISSVFRFLKNNYKIGVYKYLMVSPFTTRRTFLNLIDKEIMETKNGRHGEIFFKLNNLTDKIIINKLYEASQAGVKVKLLVRSMFSLVAGKKNLSENIEARSIVGRFLEHSRLYYFHHGGENKIYLSSFDLMERNLEGRVEVGCPIFDNEIKKELIEYLNIQWSDNVKARSLNVDNLNEYVSSNKKTEEIREINSHLKIRQFLLKKSKQ